MSQEQISGNGCLNAITGFLSEHKVLPFVEGLNLVTSVLFAEQTGKPAFGVVLFVLMNMAYWLGHNTLKPRIKPHS